MVNELMDKPGLVITDKVNRTTKVKKFIEKNKLTEYKILYLETTSNDFREIERALKDLENKYLGYAPIKEKPKQEAPFGTREYFEKYSWYYVGRLNPKCVEMVSPTRINEYKDYFKTKDYNEFIKWYKLD